MASLTPFAMRMSLEMKQSNLSSDGTEAYEEEGRKWFRAAPLSAVPEGGGGCVMVEGLQIAIFNFARRGEWYACQNLCPHKREMILSRGMLGSAQGVPKIACPFHKATFSLDTGECLNSDLDEISTYPVRIEDDYILVGLRSADLDVA